GSWAGGASFAIGSTSRRNTKPLVRAGREVDPPAVPPAFAAPNHREGRALVAALTGGSRAGSPAAHGWYLGRRPPPGSHRPRLSGGDVDGRVPIVAFRLWWATLDSNQ